MRLFASPRLSAMIQRFRPPEGEPISAGILNHSIQTAQKRVEGRNYMMRKHTLEYDDVMNKQRQEVYSFRNEILYTEDLVQEAHALLTNVCELLAQKHLVSGSQEDGWDVSGFCAALVACFPIRFAIEEFDDDWGDCAECARRAQVRVCAAFDKLYRTEVEKVMSEERAAAVVRSLILHKTDELWQEHLLAMDHLRTEVNLRAVAQRDPLIEFKHEAFRLFHDLTARLHTETARQLFKIELAPQGSLFQEILDQIHMQTNQMIFDKIEGAPPVEKLSTPPSVVPKVGRNDLCPCKSGKKYKRCCGIMEELSA